MANAPVFMLRGVATYTNNLNITMTAQIIDILHNIDKDEVTYDIQLSSGKRKIITVDRLIK